MKQVIKLDNGTRVEIDNNEVKLIGADGSVLYDTETVSYTVATPNVPYFFLIGEPERKKVAEWFDKVNSKVGMDKIRQRDFLDRVERALGIINYDYYIATLEPSFDKNENIFYEEGNAVAKRCRLVDWKAKAESFYYKDGWHSEMARLEEGDLFKAYRIAMGYWTIEYVCDDSSSAGNYWNAPDSTHDFDLSGAREVGGFKDGIGNTYEIYQMQSGFALVGGICDNNGYNFPVAIVKYKNNSDSFCNFGSGVLVLKCSTVH